MAKDTKKVITPSQANTTVVEGFVCPLCGGNSCKAVGNLPTTKFGGEMNGKEYTAVHRVRVVCDCGQYSVLRRYSYKGE